MSRSCYRSIKRNWSWWQRAGSEWIKTQR